MELTVFNSLPAYIKDIPQFDSLPFSLFYKTCSCKGMCDCTTAAHSRKTKGISGLLKQQTK